MRTEKSIELAWNMLTNSKLRSWLTIIGIVIGIGAVIAIMAISEGAQQSLDDSLNSLGADIVTVSSGFSRAGDFTRHPGENSASSSSSDDTENLTSRDITVLKGIENVASVMGKVSSKGTIVYEGKSTESTVTGIQLGYWDDFIITDLDTGRALQKGDINSVVIGYKLANEVFDGIELNRQITIEGKQFKVVGILEDGNDVYMPIDRARDVFDDIGESEFDSISVKLEDVDLSDDTMDLITEKLMMSRGILKEKEKDFSITSMAAMQESMSEMMSTITLFLGAIAAISLLVGAVGISNTMFTSVLEKTNEIGIMKAIGAKNKDIMKIFLFNSGMIGFVGGVGGVILGWVVAIVVTGYTSTSTATGGGPGRGLTGLFSSGAVVSWELIVGAFVFSIMIGMIAGAIPAYRASRLRPVDALRYE